MQVIRKYYTIYMRLKHLWILVSKGDLEPIPLRYQGTTHCTGTRQGDTACCLSSSGTPAWPFTPLDSGLALREQAQGPRHRIPPTERTLTQ